MFSERLPPWTDVTADDTDVFQVVSAEQTELAQSLAPDVSSSLPPQPAASSAAARTGSRSTFELISRDANGVRPRGIVLLG